MHQETVFLSIPMDDFRAMLTEVIKDTLPTRQVEPTAPNLMTRQEAANYLRISLPTLNEYTKEGKIEGQRIGGRLLYKLDSLQAALQSTDLKKRKGGRS